MQRAPRFRFSLRTLFVAITGLCLAFGFISIRHSLTRERHTAMEWAIEHGVGGTLAVSTKPRGSLTWWLWIVGEESHRDIYVQDIPSDEKHDYLAHIEELQRVFPEAWIEDLSRWAPLEGEMH